MLASLLFNSRRTGAVSSKQKRRKRKWASTRLSVDALEDRTVPSGVDVVSADPQDWAMYNHDPEGTRYNLAEHILSPESVGDLDVVWRFETPGAIAGTPAVVNNIVYAADSTGTVYALDHEGQELWHTDLPIESPFPLKLTASPLVTNRTLIIGDVTGQIHGVDTDDGDVRWTIRPPSPGPVFGDQHPFQAIFGSATMVGNNVAIGISSVEEAAPVIVPDYPGFTFSGSLVLLDPADGDIIWQSFTVGAPTFQDEFGEFGPSGASIWSTPTYDRASNTIYATTGNNYSQPTTVTGDAIVAFDATDGHIKWVTQMTTDDTWNYRYAPKDTGDPPDFDFGDSPQIYMLNGQKVVGAGQKSGFYHVVDANTGEIINQYQAAPGGSLGGLYADSAVANGIVFANGVDWDDPFGDLPNPTSYNGGSLTAIKGDGSGELWSFETPAPNISGVAVANDVVYFSSIDGILYALNTADGSLLAEVNTAFQMGDVSIAGVSSGPAISRGRVYVGLGDTLTNLTNPFAVPPGGAVVAFGVPKSLPQIGTPAAVNDFYASDLTGTVHALTRDGESLAAAPATQENTGPLVKMDAVVAYSIEVGELVLSGQATHLGTFRGFAQIDFPPAPSAGTFGATGIAVLQSANGHLLVGVIEWSLNSAGEGQMAFSWRDSVTLRDGSVFSSTGRFAESRPGGTTATTDGRVSRLDRTMEIVRVTNELNQTCDEINDNSTLAGLPSDSIVSKIFADRACGKFAHLK